MIESEVINTTSKSYIFERPVNSREAAPLFGLHYKTLERMARLGQVPAAKPGKEWLFRTSRLSKWFDLQMDANISGQNNSSSEEATNAHEAHT
jgi:excisionase family DNA binding protein